MPETAGELRLDPEAERTSLAWLAEALRSPRSGSPYL